MKQIKDKFREWLQRLETTCNCCDKDFSYEYEDLKSYETIYEGELSAVEYVFCPHCGAEVITDI